MHSLLALPLHCPPAIAGHPAANKTFPVRITPGIL